MRPFSSTEEFIKFIIEDYKKGTSDMTAKFLFQYFKKRKNGEFDRASGVDNSSSDDDYIRLKWFYNAYKKGEKNKNEYFDICRGVNNGLRARKIDPQILEDLFANDPGEAQIRLENKILSIYVYRFVDNRKKPKKSKTGENYDVLEMLCEYQKYHKENESYDGIVSKEYIQKCQELYDAMLESDPDAFCGEFVPLYIDRRSGAGVFIIGNNSLRTEKPKVCVLSYFNNRMISADDAKNLNMLISGREPAQPPVLTVNAEINDACGSVEDAFSVLQVILENGQCYSGFPGTNFSEKPETIDKQFLPFFLDLDDLRDEIKKRYKASRQNVKE